VRVGVFGGEFDPPHLAHVTVARVARDQLALDRLLVVPAGAPPHRAESTTPAATRLRMAELAFAGERAIEVSPIEIDRGGTSHTLETLEQLAPLGELFLIMGADQLASFDSWREPEAIRELATLVVAPRTGFDPTDSHAVALEMAPVDLSSTDVRARLRTGDGEQFVPAAVLALIRAQGLYGGTPC
jgi:nicotinate-nucleotide adenylyltransferase